MNETTLQSPPPHKKSSSAASENNNNVNNNTNNNNNNTAISSKQGGVSASTTTAAATSKGRGSIKSIGSGSVRRSPPTPRPLVPAGGGVVRRVSQLKRPTTTAHHQLSSSEARITKTLGIIMGVFVVCWLPFFLIYNVRSQLADPDSISGNTMEFFLWLGYFNSALNPILYAILNANFRNAFRDILACRCCLPGVSHSSLNRFDFHFLYSSSHQTPQIYYFHSHFYYYLFYRSINFPGYFSQHILFYYPSLHLCIYTFLFGLIFETLFLKTLYW